MAGVKVGIVGGGASGMVAAIAAAREGAHVTLLERGGRIGRKLLVTGNGRCNLGNRALSQQEYYCGDSAWLGGCLGQFGTEDTVHFFGSLGLLIKDRGGYLYPACEQASVVLDVLRAELKARKVQVVTDCKINGVHGGRDGKIVLESDEGSFLFDHVVLACGGRAAPRTGSDGNGYALAAALGHTIMPTVPALVQLRCREDYFRAVAGVRADAEVRLCRKGRPAVSERGELQLVEYGISGIPVFQLSRRVGLLLREGGEVEISLNLLPDMDEAGMEELVQSREPLREGRTVEEFFTGLLHKKIMMLFIKQAGLKPSLPAREASPEGLERVYGLCRDWRVHVTASNSYEHAQVTAGGVDVGEVTAGLESKKFPGVFFAGEMLDVDGRCGGYNLQWAWCSGYLAGRAAALCADRG